MPILALGIVVVVAFHVSWYFNVCEHPRHAGKYRDLRIGLPYCVLLLRLFPSTLDQVKAAKINQTHWR
jgi:hypothetical protein